MRGLALGDLTILHGGQTGVDRAAHHLAIAWGLPIDGYAPQDGRDEDGPIPPEVRDRLRLCGTPGLAERTRHNVELATAVLVITPDPLEPYATPGTALTLRLARSHRRPSLVIGPGYPVDRANRWLAEAQNGLWCSLLVAGPRASKWPDGERVALALLYGLSWPVDHQVGP